MVPLSSLKQLLKNLRINSQCCNSSSSGFTDSEVEDIKSALLSKLEKLQSELNRCISHQQSLLKEIAILEKCVADIPPTDADS